MASDGDDVPSPPTSLRVERFTSDQGLASNHVQTIMQDRKGFLWIGTTDGLSRFDGYRFKNYKFDFFDERSLPSNNVRVIYETKNSELWVGTQDGLSKYVPRTDSFETYRFERDESGLEVNTHVTVIHEAQDGMLWLGTGVAGLAKFDRKTKSFRRFMWNPKDSRTITGNDIFGIVEDDDSYLWLATYKGLSRFDPKTEKAVRYYNVPSDSESLNNNKVISIARDRNGSIWLGSRNWLNRLDPRKQTFSSYEYVDNGSGTSGSKSIDIIYGTNRGELLLGNADRLHFFNVQTGVPQATFKNVESDSRSLTKGNITRVFEDKQGQLWIGTTGGLNKYSRRSSRFEVIRSKEGDPKSIANDNCSLILEDKDKNLWFATREKGYRGLIKYDRNSDSFEKITSKYGTPTFLHEDKKGTLWVATFEGLFFFDEAKTRLSSYKVSGFDSYFERIDALDSDEAGNLWIGTHDGRVSRVHIESQTVTPLFQRVPGSNDRIRDILVDKSGNVWVGSRRTLKRFDSRTLKETRYSYDPKNSDGISAIYSETIFEDKEGNIWIGTRAGGLNKFNSETDSFEHFTERDGLANNTVLEIVEDERGFIWISTLRGLSQFDPNKKVFRNYFVSDGLPYSQFNPDSAFLTSDGQMYFGTPNGLVTFKPSDFGENKFEPPIYLSDLRILEKSIAEKEDVTSLKEIELSYQQYLVSFEFAALDLTDTSNIKYQWKLEGFDNEWVRGGTRRVATYNSLQGGEYVLKVKSTNANGVWGSEKQILKVVVIPPFYKTLWFFALILMAVCLSVFWAFRYRMNQLQRTVQEKVLYSRRLIETQEAERKRLASELHDGLGQELILIKNRALLGMKNEEDFESANTELMRISETASEALVGVREITNNLRPQLLDRVGLTKAIESMLKRLSGMITLESKIDDIDGLFKKEAEIGVFRIIQEAVNNVFKHADADNLVVRVEKGIDVVSLTIEDDGKGFDSSVMKGQKGGLGLTGLRERAESLGGEFSIKSESSRGTLVKVTIPYSV